MLKRRGLSTKVLSHFTFTGVETAPRTVVHRCHFHPQTRQSQACRRVIWTWYDMLSRNMKIKRDITSKMYNLNRKYRRKYVRRDANYWHVILMEKSLFPHTLFMSLLISWRRSFYVSVTRTFLKSRHINHKGIQGLNKAHNWVHGCAERWVCDNIEQLIKQLQNSHVKSYSQSISYHG